MKALIKSIFSSIRRSAARTKGQTLVEYALILAIISVVAIAVFALLGSRIQSLFSAVTLILDTAQSSH